MSFTGLVSQNSQEDVVVQGSYLSRGYKRRNERLARLRGLVPTDNAIVVIDLADEKQALVVTDHDSRVLARRRVRAKAWELGSVLAWARQQARQHGFTDVTVGCEPTASLAGARSARRPAEYCAGMCAAAVGGPGPGV